jgi:hypothetical protein
MAVTEVVLFDQLSDENNYSTFHYLGRKEAMKSGHHGFLLTQPPAFKNPPDSKLQFQMCETNIR